MLSTRFLSALCTLSLLLMANPMEATETLDYSMLQQKMLASHPELISMQREIDAAEASVDGASALPDPMIRIEWMDIDRQKPSLNPNQVGSVQYTWEQMFPLWGKRGLKAEAATAGIAIAKANTVQTEAELRAMLRMAYAEFHAAWRGYDINDEVLGLLREMERNAQVRYSNGLSAQQDVIKAKTEQTMLIAEQQMLQGEAERAQTQINSLLGFTMDTRLPTNTTLSSVNEIEQSYLLWQQQLKQTPALQIADATVKKRTAENKLAEREWYPDLTVGITPIQMEDRIESWQLMLGVSVPLFGSRRAMETESVAMLASAQAKQEATYRRIVGKVNEILIAFRAAKNQESIFLQQLLPETELNFRSALAGYQTGKVDFDTLIEAERQIRKTRLLALAAAVGQQRAAAQFVQITGMPL